MLDIQKKDPDTGNSAWYWHAKTQDFYRWKDLPKESPDIKLWAHYCTVEEVHLGIEVDKLCKFCGQSEISS